MPYRKHHTRILAPTPEQESILRQVSGVARKAYNVSIFAQQQNHEAGGAPLSYSSLLTSLKETAEDFVWGYGEEPPANAVLDAHQVFSDYLRKKRRNPEQNPPGFRRKRHGAGSFRLSQGVRFEEDRLCLPFTAGKPETGIQTPLPPIALGERPRLPERFQTLSATIKEEEGRWVIHFLAEIEGEYTPPKHEGNLPEIDPERAKRRLAVLTRMVESKQPTSKNRHRAQARLDKFRRRLENQKQSLHFKVVAQLVKASPEELPQKVTQFVKLIRESSPEDAEAVKKLLWQKLKKFSGLQTETTANLLRELFKNG